MRGFCRQGDRSARRAGPLVIAEALAEFPHDRDVGAGEPVNRLPVVADRYGHQCHRAARSLFPAVAPLRYIVRVETGSGDLG